MKLLFGASLLLISSCLTGYTAWHFLDQGTCRAADNCPDIEWIRLPEGQFSMGDERFATPVHPVRLSAFDLMKTEVTVAQYRACLEAGACYEPDLSGYSIDEGCATDATWRRDDAASAALPANCLPRFEMERFAAWVGARLPTEAEWEYAATSGGQPRKYPWGDDPATCDWAVIHSVEGVGCGAGAVAPVCSKPAGNSEQGLCDLIGNLVEMTADTYSETYANADPNGGPDRSGDSSWAARGGSFEDSLIWRSETPESDLEARRREVVSDEAQWTVGFRLARAVEP
jgi:formylglycine-generating enzyme required for sulfatase activity